MTVSAVLSGITGYPDTEVDSDLGPGAYTLYDRFGETFHAKHDFNAPCNGTGDDSPGINAAIAAFVASSSTRGVVALPPGPLRLESQLNLTSLGSKVLRLSGAGRQNSRLVVNFATGDWLKIGDPAGTEIDGLTIEGLRFDANVTQTSDGFADIRKAKDVRIRDIYVSGCRSFLTLGSNTRADDVQRVYVTDFFSSGGTASAPWVNLRSGSIIHFARGMFNGTNAAGAYLFDHTDTAQNIDGLFITDCVGEDWARMLSSTGKGISNAQVIGGIFDTPSDYSIYAAAAAGGVNRRWLISTVLQGPSELNTAQAIHFENGAGAGRELVVSGSRIFDYGGTAIELGGSMKACSITANSLLDCGYDAGATRALIKAGSGTAVAITGNAAGVVDHAGYDYGIEWVGAAMSGARVAAGNVWQGAGSGDTAGTV